MEDKKCSICNKPITKENTWHWADEPAHKLCVIDKSEIVCDEMNCFSMMDEKGEECECGSTMKPITKRERTALMKVI